MTKETLTVPEAAKEMGLHTSTVSNWCAKGRIKGIKVKGSWEIKRQDLEAFKESRAKGQLPAETAVVDSPQPARPELSKRVQEIHADAEKMVKDRQEILAHLFPHPRPGEVYDYVLHNMAPKGLREMPSLEEFIQMELKAEEQETMLDKEPEETYDGDLGTRLAQAENEMEKLMKHSSASVRNLATLLHGRIQKIKAENRKIIEDYVRSQEEKDGG
jgi:excisionase family DNA binding protein